ncbi:MAG: hypothetical protein ACI89L_002140 [Phycisphaerales bacterium]|jgi:hypothetical protein
MHTRSTAPCTDNPVVAPRPSRLIQAIAAIAAVAFSMPAIADPTLDPNHPQGLSLVSDTGQSVVLNASHGGIIGITDDDAPATLAFYNLYGPWVLRFTDGHWMDANTFGASNPARTSSWAWDQAAGVLDYHLVSTDAHAVDVRYTVSPDPAEGFAITLTITNNSAFDLDVLSFPSHLAIPRASVDYALMPYIEGVELRKGFFDALENYNTGYPGAMFADFAFFSIDSQPAALFFAHDPGVDLKASRWAIRYDGPGNSLAKVFHDFTTIVAPGETWASPVFRVLANVDHETAMDAYWQENGHDRGPKLADKLDPAVAGRLAGAVLFKRDFLQSTQTFAQFEAYLPQLPTDNLIHPVAFWPRGFDENYPDYLPTDPKLGSTAQFNDLVQTMRRDFGHLVMPYTNPTWWDNQAPTYQSLGPGITAKNPDGSIIWESYGGGNHSGVVVSPYHPDVIARQDQTRTEFTTTVPCDFLFEDQVGARSGRVDANPAAPSRSSYTQGLINIAQRTSQTIPAWTEGGFDALAPHEIAFCNSVRVGWHPWADSSWRSFPLAPLWARDQLVFTAHNLAPYSMTNDPGALAEQLASGYSLSYSIVPPIDSAWVFYLDAVQKRIVAPLFGVAMTGFGYDAEGVSTTEFEDGTTLVANRNASELVRGDHTLAGEGFVYTDTNGFRAGRVTRVNSLPLSGGAHTLAISRDEPGVVRLDHPEGPNTLLTLAASGLGSAPAAFGAVLADGSIVPQIFSVAGDSVQLLLLTHVNRQSVDHFTLTLATCPPDLNGDGVVDNGDIGAFVAAFLAGNLAAEFNDDGILDNGDISTFITAFLAGC